MKGVVAVRNKKICKLLVFVFSAAVIISTIRVPLMAQDEIPIVKESELLTILNSSNVDETKGKLYLIESDITIDSNDLTNGRVFAGEIDGNNHTITIKGDGTSVPLFEKLQGSMSDLTIKFENDVAGAPLAYDVSYYNVGIPTKISNVDIIVDGNVVYGDHNFRDYYAAILDYPYNYGNWYIHFGCQPVHLATGFAWYLWGVALDDVSVTINGDVGDPEKVEGDATSAGFAYFAVKGGADYDVIFNNIDVIVNGNIQSNTNDGHAAAYGFATGDAAGTAGFGENTIEEASHININANNILSYSANGSSSSMGFARFAQGYTHDCLVNVPGKIEAVNMEGDEEEDEYAYSNGDAYAYGFILNTGGSSIASRRNFENNQVVAGNIFARTDSKEFAGSAFAAGFAHQMMNTATDVPDLSYNNNSVKIINGSITAEANAGSAVSSGFVTSSGRDYYDRPDHIFANSVYVNGSITASSKEADATATGYSYMNKTHRRDCSVEVNGDIIASSPVQSIASGFNGLQYIDNYYFINSSKVKVAGDIAAIQSGNEEGVVIAAGLNGAIMGNSSGNADTKVRFGGNIVEVYGNILSKSNDQSEGYSGLLLAIANIPIITRVISKLTIIHLLAKSH